MQHSIGRPAADLLSNIKEHVSSSFATSSSNHKVSLVSLMQAVGFANQLAKAHLHMLAASQRHCVPHVQAVEFAQQLVEAHMHKPAADLLAWAQSKGGSASTPGSAVSAIVGAARNAVVGAAAAVTGGSTGAQQNGGFTEKQHIQVGWCALGWCLCRHARCFTG